MFEAIHGSAPRDGQRRARDVRRPKQRHPAAAMLLGHVGFVRQADAIYDALALCAKEDCPVRITGRNTGSTSQEYTDYLISLIKAK